MAAAFGLGRSSWKIGKDGLLTRDPVDHLGRIQWAGFAVLDSPIGMRRGHGGVRGGAGSSVSGLAALVAV
jgi:hypothetical protein